MAILQELKKMNGSNSNKEKSFFSILFRVLGVGCFSLLTFGRFRVLYAPFEYAPSKWDDLVCQGIVLCIVHMFCCLAVSKALSQRLDSPFFVIISLISINTAMWAVAREAAFAITLKQAFIDVYYMLYLVAFIPTVSTFVICIWKRRHIEQGFLHAVIRNSNLLLTSFFYFLGLQQLPLYQYAGETHLLLIYYVYNLNRFVLICALIGELICIVIKKVYQRHEDGFAVL